MGRANVVAQLSPKTVKIALDFLSGALEWELRRAEPRILRNVVRGVKVRQTERQEPRTLELAEAQRLLAVLDAWPIEEQNRANLLILALLTMRRAESAYGGLRWCDVDFDSRRLTFNQYLLWGVPDGKGHRYSFVRADNHKHRLESIQLPEMAMAYQRRALPRARCVMPIIVRNSYVSRQVSRGGRLSCAVFSANSYQILTLGGLTNTSDERVIRA